VLGFAPAEISTMIESGLVAGSDKDKP